MFTALSTDVDNRNFRTSLFFSPPECLTPRGSRRLPVDIRSRHRNARLKILRPTGYPHALHGWPTDPSTPNQRHILLLCAFFVTIHTTHRLYSDSYYY